MPSYAVAKDILSESDKARLLCCFLNTESPKIDYEKATEEFGSSSVNSMRTMVGNAYRKIREAENPEPSTKKAKSSKATLDKLTPKKNENRKPVNGNKRKRVTPNLETTTSDLDMTDDITLDEIDRSLLGTLLPAPEAEKPTKGSKRVKKIEDHIKEENDVNEDGLILLDCSGIQAEDD